MSIEKRNSGYTVRWRDNSGAARSKQVSLWRDAVTLDGEMKRLKAMGLLVQYDRGKETLGDFYRLWCRNYGAVNLTPRTMENYNWLWKKHIAPTMGRARLREIDPGDVSALSGRLSNLGTLAPGTVRKVLVLLQTILSRAVEWGYIQSNPAAVVRKPRATPRRGRALSMEQLDAICLELPRQGAHVVRVLAYTGLRPGELRALTWDRVLEDRIIVDRAASSNAVGPTKTRQRRFVLLSPAARAVFNEWRLSTGSRSGSDLVFPGPRRGRKLWTDDGWRDWQKRVFAPAVMRAGLRNVVPYDLRHTFVSTLIGEGRSPIEVAHQAGHSPAMALTTYAHEFELVYSECAPANLTKEIPRAHRRI